MGLFGPDFRVGSSALVILAAGQFVNAAVGSVGYLLVMTEYHKIVLNITVLSAFLNIALNGILIPRLGILGAALATATSIITFNILSMLAVRKKLQIRILL
jgi:O-antigen/teichoic acid export membrane protein